MNQDVIKLEKPIATVDIESLDLDPTAVVFEIGIIVTNVLPLPGTRWDSSFLAKGDYIYEKATIYPSVLQQVLLGRTTSPSTIAFHHKLYAERGEEKSFEDHLEALQVNGRTLPIKAVREYIQNFFSLYGVKEVWMNHPQFDETRIESMMRSDGLTLPWAYNAGCDISTAKTLYRKKVSRDQDKTLKLPKAKDDHTGIADCCYNLAVLSICLE